VRGCGLSSVESGQGPVAGPWGHSNETSGCIQGGSFFEQLSDCQILKKDHALALQCGNRSRIPLPGRF
jgi:hypothetical protein